MRADMDGLLEKKEVSHLSPETQVFLKKNDSISKEGYYLNVNPGGITIMASTSAGAFYGIQSLKTLIPPSKHCTSPKRNTNPLRGNKR